jgi:hypothetical protein
LLGISKRGDTYLRMLLAFAHNASKSTGALNAVEWLRLGRFIGPAPSIAGMYSSSTYRHVRKT